MENFDFSKLLTNQPELYAILAFLVYGIKKIVPLITSSVDTQKEHLACSKRIEKNADDTLRTILGVESNIRMLATKGDMLDVLLNKSVQTNTDTIKKQDSLNGSIPP